MRILGLVLALGAIVWVMMQAAGDSETVIPEGHKDSLKKAEAVEQMLQNTAQQRLQDLDREQE